MSKSKNTILLNTLLVIFLAILIISSYFLYKEVMVYKEGSDEYSSLSNLAVSSLDNDANGNKHLRRVIDFQELKKTNSDVIGWIYIPDTVVDYPVVQCDNNDKYLHTLFSGKKNKSGTIFVDTLNSMNFNDDNTIFYGHNMRNKSMFHILSEYQNQEFYDKHNTVYYYTIDGVYELRIFSAYTVNAYDNYTSIKFGDKRTELINSFINRSTINPSFTVGPEDKIATLSTCAYDFNDARFVVQATVHKMPYGGYQ